MRDDAVGLAVRETEFGYFDCEKKAKLSGSEVPEVVSSGEED